MVHLEKLLKDGAFMTLTNIVFPSTKQFKDNTLITCDITKISYPFTTSIIPKWINERMYYEAKFIFISDTEATVEFSYVSPSQTKLLMKQSFSKMFENNKASISIEYQNKAFIFKNNGINLYVVYNDALFEGLVGYTPIAISNFHISQPKTSGWSIVPNANFTFVREDENRFEIRNDSKLPTPDDENFKAYISKVLALNVGSVYSFSYYSDTESNYEVVDISQNPNLLIKKSKGSGNITFSFEATALIEVRFSKSNLGISNISKFQLEQGDTTHDYVPTKETSETRRNSTLTIPSKNNINRRSGSFVTKIVIEKIQESFGICSVGNFSLYYENNAFCLLSGKVKAVTKKIEVPAPSKQGEFILAWTWEENNHKLAVGYNGAFYEVQNMNGTMNEDYGLIDFYSSPLFKGEIISLLISSDNFIYSQCSDNILQNLQNGSLLYIDFSKKTQFKQNPFIENSLAPLDGSPILVSDDIGDLRRNYFFDYETGKYETYTKEEFEYTGDYKLVLAYENLDSNFKITVAKKDGELVGEPLYQEGNQVFLTLSQQESEDLLGEVLTVTYQLERSFVVEFNETSALDSYQIKFSDYPKSNINVVQEGNRFSKTRLSKEIELNPIVNPRHKGFLYIVQNNQEVNGFRMNVTSDMVHANGLDSAEVIVEAIDEDGNEVLSPYIDIFLVDEKGNTGAELGYVRPIISYDTLKSRNTAGRLYFRYYSPYLYASSGRKTKKVFVVAYDRIKKIGIQIPLILKPTTNSIKNRNTLVLADTALGFEYLSRYFERSSIPAKVLEALDFDGNGQLTKEDLDIFATNQYSESENIRVNQLLKELGDN